MAEPRPCNDAEVISSFECFEVFPHLVRLLARGEPVRVEELAATSGRPVEAIEALARSQPGTEWDEEGRLVGFGLSLRPTPHRLTVAGQTLYTWCAEDTLMFTVILGEPSEVASTCPATGAPIRLELDPDHVVSASPPSAVVTELAAARPGGDLRGEVCDHGHFFAAAEAASAWAAEHPDGEVLAVADAFARSRDACRALGWLPAAEPDR
ncbi:MAG: organomercurial lyase MerB [Candidatus Dormibacteria bacterium]